MANEGILKVSFNEVAEIVKEVVKEDYNFTYVDEYINDTKVMLKYLCKDYRWTDESSIGRRQMFKKVYFTNISDNAHPKLFNSIHAILSCFHPFFYYVNNKLDYNESLFDEKIEYKKLEDGTSICSIDELKGYISWHLHDYKK